jgi:hypothetical protein
MAQADVAAVAQKATDALCCVAVIYVEASRAAWHLRTTDGAGVILRSKHLVELFYGDSILALHVALTRADQTLVFVSAVAGPITGAVVVYVR